MFFSMFSRPAHRKNLDFSGANQDVGRTRKIPRMANRPDPLPDQGTGNSESSRGNSRATVVRAS